MRAVISPNDTVHPRRAEGNRIHGRARPASGDTFGSASFQCVVRHAADFEKLVLMVLPRAKDDPTVCNNAQGRNIEVLLGGKAQNFELAKELILALRPHGSSIEAQVWPRITAPVLGESWNGATRRD